MCDFFLVCVNLVCSVVLVLSGGWVLYLVMMLMHFTGVFFGQLNDDSFFGCVVLLSIFS